MYAFLMAGTHTIYKTLISHVHNQVVQHNQVIMVTYKKFQEKEKSPISIKIHIVKEFLIASEKMSHKHLG